jgi:hypothetical protein
MYNFIFYIFYKRNIEDGRLLARFNGSIMVFLTIIIHLFLVLFVLRKFLGITLETSFPQLFQNKGSKYLLCFIFMGAIAIFYSDNRIKTILERYSAKPQEKRKSNFKILSILGIPFLLLLIIGSL